MVRNALVVAMLLGSAMLMAAAPACAVNNAIVAKAVDSAPGSRLEGEQAIDAAVAASLIGAISGQFDEPTVQIKLDSMEVTPAGIVQRDVSGNGRLMLGNDHSWIPFRYSALYDTTRTSVDFPSLTLGGNGQGRDMPENAPVARLLTAEVDRKLDHEFAGQAVTLALESVRMLPAGARYATVEGDGTVDFGVEGTAQVTVHALYDTNSSHWVRVSYELGAAASRPRPDTVAIR